MAWHIETKLDGFAREETGAEHDRWIRSIGAGGDRGDDDCAVIDSSRDTVDGDGYAAISRRG
jgi:hypothetical protein